MFHMLANKGQASQAIKVTLASRRSRVEVGTYHDGFVTHFPWTSWKHDAVWVIVDKLTKSAHFLAVRITFTLEEFYRLYI